MLSTGIAIIRMTEMLAVAATAAAWKLCHLTRTRSNHSIHQGIEHRQTKNKHREEEYHKIHRFTVSNTCSVYMHIQLNVAQCIAVIIQNYYKNVILYTPQLHKQFCD